MNRHFLLSTGLVVVGYFYSSLALAQIPGMSQPDMQGMMQAAQQAQKCFSQIDQSAVRQLAEEGSALEGKISALCKAGARDEAMQHALAYGRKISNDPNVLAMRECGEAMRGMLPALPFDDIEEQAQESGHLCDGY